jgi:hypothetical protein
MWFAVNEIMSSVVCFTVNLVAGKLDIEVPSNPHLICSRLLDHTDLFTAAGFVSDGLKVS